MKALTPFFTFLILFNNWAQDDTPSNYRFGIQITAEDPLIRYYSYHDLNKIFTPQLTYSNNRHQFEIGASFAPLRRPEYETKLGARVGYSFYPNGRNQLFSSYLRFAIPFQFVKDDPTSYVPSTLGNYVNPIYHQYWSLNVQGGYGIQLNLGDKFYLGSDISLLFGVIVQDYEFTSTINNNSEKSQRRYLFFHPQFGMNVGFRF